MGSIDTLLQNFDFVAFIKDFIGNLADGDSFKEALSSAGSSEGSSALSSDSSQAADAANTAGAEGTTSGAAK